MSFIDLFAAKIDANSAGIPKISDTGLLSGVLGTVYWAAGVVAVIVIIIGGILYATSDGDPSKVKRAKDSIVYAIAGLVIVLMAFLITQFVIGRF